MVADKMARRAQCSGRLQRPRNDEIAGPVRGGNHGGHADTKPDGQARRFDHLGYRGGRHVVLRFPEAVSSIGGGHVILDFKYGARDAAGVLEDIGTEILTRLAESQP